MLYWLIKTWIQHIKYGGTSLGYKHSPETLLKFKDRKHSVEALVNLKLSKAGIAPSALTKTNQILATAYITIIVNKQNNTVKEYSSMRAAARDIGVSHATILSYSNNNKYLKGIYIITIKKKLI